ncbi:AAA family ATPase [Rhodococcus opacus]|nr:AAA family ATPase [Rhodococcus opacus]
MTCADTRRDRAAPRVPRLTVHRGRPAAPGRRVRVGEQPEVVPHGRRGTHPDRPPSAAARADPRTVAGREPACGDRAVRDPARGATGGGKSSTHERLFHGHDQRQWRELDADVFKRYLLEAAVEDGTLQELLPPDLRVDPGQTSRFYPLELSALVHHESTVFLFTAAEREAVDRGENLIVDGTLAWKPHAERLVAGLAEAGYRIQVVDVEAPKDVAAERIVARWRRGFLQAQGAQRTPSAVSVGGGCP